MQSPATPPSCESDQLEITPSRKKRNCAATFNFVEHSAFFDCLPQILTEFSIKDLKVLATVNSIWRNRVKYVLAECIEIPKVNLPLLFSLIVFEMDAFLKEQQSFSRILALTNIHEEHNNAEQKAKCIHIGPHSEILTTIISSLYKSKGARSISYFWNATPPFIKLRSLQNFFAFSKSQHKPTWDEVEVWSQDLKATVKLFYDDKFTKGILQEYYKCALTFYIETFLTHNTTCTVNRDNFHSYISKLLEDTLHAHDTKGRSHLRAFYSSVRKILALISNKTCTIDDVVNMLDLIDPISSSIRQKIFELTWRKFFEHKQFIEAPLIIWEYCLKLTKIDDFYSQHRMTRYMCESLLRDHVELFTSILESNFQILPSFQIPFLSMLFEKPCLIYRILHVYNDMLEYSGINNFCRALLSYLCRNHQFKLAGDIVNSFPPTSFLQFSLITCLGKFASHTSDSADTSIDYTPSGYISDEEPTEVYDEDFEDD